LRLIANAFMSISRFSAMKILTESECRCAPLSLNTVALLTASIADESMEISSVRNPGSKYAVKPDQGTSAATATATAGTSIWNYQVRHQATMIIKETIEQQQRIVAEMDKLIAHTRPRLEAARGSARNETGILIFAKSLQKYESAKVHAVKAIPQLQALAMEVRYSLTRMDYRARMESILHPQLHRTSTTFRCTPCDYLDDASSVTSSFSKRSLAFSSDSSSNALERMRHLEQVLTKAIGTIDAI